jgi:hypothetical protein
MAREYGTHDTTEEDLTAQLPTWMPKDEDSGNYALLKPVAEEIKGASADINAVDRSLTAQHAETIPQLREIGKFVDLPPYRNEGLEHYRSRIIAAYQMVTSQGTVMDILTGVSAMLNTDISNLGYTEQHTTEAGSALLSVPGSKLDSLAISDSELADMVSRLMASSYRIDVLIEGTFTYITEAQYQDTNFTHDATKGYDGLDANGNPKGNGGTYSTVLE